MASRKKHSKPNKTKKPNRAKKAKRNVRASATTAPFQNRLSPGDWFEKLVAIQKRLRDPGGCPWDREQTHETLRTYLIEEAYEVLDALDSGDDEKFIEELGDLLLQVAFHSQIASEEGRFEVSDVIRAVHDKMIRRHPHVFGDLHAKDSDEVLRNWQKIKAQERQAKDSPASAASAPANKTESALDGVPRAIPATLEGLQLTKKAARIGFDWENPEGILEKLREETGEVERALKSGDRPHIEEELGDLLFAAVNLARFVHIDPEIALKNANAKFVRRFHEMERLAAQSGRKFEDVPRSEKETLWNSAKVAGSTGKAVPRTKRVGIAQRAGHPR
jgi:MazG family protein